MFRQWVKLEVFFRFILFSFQAGSMFKAPVCLSVCVCWPSICLSAYLSNITELFIDFLWTTSMHKLPHFAVAFFHCMLGSTHSVCPPSLPFHCKRSNKSRSVSQSVSRRERDISHQPEKLTDSQTDIGGRTGWRDFSLQSGLTNINQMKIIQFSSSSSPFFSFLFFDKYSPPPVPATSK